MSSTKAQVLSKNKGDADAEQYYSSWGQKTIYVKIVARLKVAVPLGHTSFSK